MKSLMSIAPGGPETLALTETPGPAVEPGVAVVAVKACAVNFPDLLIIEDKYQVKPPRPFAPGCEIAGVVKAVGEGVTCLRVGDRVLGGASHGGMAEEQAIPFDRLFRIPDAMPFDEAAALVMTFGTSHHALRDRGRLQPGDRLLVLGAAGGVGLAAVQLGKMMGAHVVAAASSQDKVDLCLSHGADEGLVYPRGPFDRDEARALAERFKTHGGADGFQVIYDAVGGDYTEAALRAIGWGGRHLVVGFAAGEIPRIALNLALLKGCDIVGVFWGAWVSRTPRAHAETVAELLRLYAQGAIRPLISAHYSLERGGDAIARLASRQAVGKIVVMVD